ncbi:unnamed protein product, partial [marine sediment metagenome]
KILKEKLDSNFFDNSHLIALARCKNDLFRERLIDLLKTLIVIYK